MHDFTRQPLVSVIVPVYNVEQYLVACVKSILSQTYRNLDIILVDDGSTDTSGTLCDELALLDNRIRVIHQKNGGLSAARNTGIELINGDYIVFVDSDDLLHPAYVSTLLNILLKENVSLVMCDMQRFSCDKPEFSCAANPDIERLSSKETIRRFLLGEWWSAWAKLYKADIFKTIRFPVGRNNEDYAILTRVFEQTDSVLYLHTPLYYYRSRPGSITRSKLNSHSFDEIDNCVEVLQEISERHPEFYAEAEANLAYSLEKLYRELQNTKSQEHRPRLLQIKELYKKHGASFLANPYIINPSKFFIWFHVNLPLMVPLIVKLYILYKKQA